MKIIKIIKLVSGEELIGKIDDEFYNKDKFEIDKPRIIAIGYHPQTQEPVMQLIPFIKSDPEGAFVCLMHSVIGWNKSELLKNLEDYYLQDTSGIQLVTK